jgi:hypothetical protein
MRTNMKTTLKNIALALLAALVVLLAPHASWAQQNLIVQTTLSAALTAPATPGAPPVPSGFATLASVTGITAISGNATATINQQNQWVLFVDREEMAVVGVNGTTLQVLRGWNSTVASGHASGAMVLYGRANWFYQYDPGASAQTSGGISGVPCTSTTVFVTPWVNVRTGSQWLCSSITSTWVPGFNNPLVVSSSVATATVASAAGVILPSGPLFSVSGALAITGFTIPVGCNATAVGGCQFTIIPTGAFTWTAAGNIAIVGTAVVGVSITFVWNAATSKWQPSYNLVTV